METTEARLRKAGVEGADAVRATPRALVQYSPERRGLNLELRKFLYRNLYFHPAVAEPNNRATRMLGELFQRYVEKPDEMGEGAARRVSEIGLHRAVCDAIASRTDRFCIEEHHRLFGLYVGPFRPR